MQDAMQRAERFLEAHGSALDRGRLAVLRGEDAAPARTALEALQREDGSFPELPGAELEAAHASTAAALAVLAELRVRRAPSVERAVVFLAGRQAADGSWGDGPPEERLATTGRVGGVLGRTLYARPEGLAAAAGFLGRHFAPERVEGVVGGAWSTLTGVAAFFTNVDHERADDVLQWCGRALEKGFRSRAVSALGVARVLVACDVAGLPGARLDPTELVLGILAEQDADGGWFPDAAAPAPRAQVTLDAALALARLTAVAPG